MGIGTYVEVYIGIEEAGTVTAGTLGQNHNRELAPLRQETK